MTEYTHLWLYFLMVFGVIALPGMDMAFVLASALSGGRRAGAFAVAGIVFGGLCHTAAGALGIGLTNGMIAVGIVMFPALARIVRARTLIVRQELYVDASRCFGAPAWHILWRHVLPNALPPVIVQVTLLLAAALLAEASLSFLGLGIQPPNPSWGAMLARAYQYMEIAPEQMYGPGLAILVVSLAFNALGESLRIVLDPTMKDR